MRISGCAAVDAYDKYLGVALESAPEPLALDVGDIGAAQAEVQAAEDDLWATGLGDVPLRDWQSASLLAPSTARTSQLQAIEIRMLQGPLGSLSDRDLEAVQRSRGCNVRRVRARRVENGAARWQRPARTTPSAQM